MLLNCIKRSVFLDQRPKEEVISIPDGDVAGVVVADAFGSDVDVVVAGGNGETLRTVKWTSWSSSEWM